jgi:periplasmic protein TonB
VEKGPEQFTIPVPARAAAVRSIRPARVVVPGVLMPRRLGPAWVVSLVVHRSLLVLALWGVGREIVSLAPTVRLVFVAPPPPPLGAPEGKGSAPIAETPPQKAEKPPPPVKPELKPPKRSVTPKQLVKLEELKPSPPIAVEPPVTTAATTPVEEPRTGVATGRVEGVEGGIAGGVVSGVIAAPLRVDQVARPPVLISRVDPDYPEVARLREIEGRVVLEAIVDREGQVEPEITVLQSLPVLNNAAVTAVRQWRFTPGRGENGQAVRVILEVPIRFMLE